MNKTTNILQQKPNIITQLMPSQGFFLSANKADGICFFFIFNVNNNICWLPIRFYSTRGIKHVGRPSGFNKSFPTSYFLYRKQNSPATLEDKKEKIHYRAVFFLWSKSCPQLEEVVPFYHDRDVKSHDPLFWLHRGPVKSAPFNSRKSQRESCPAEKGQR